MKNFSIAAAAIPLLLASSIVHANNEFHKIYAAADLEIESELVKFTNRDLTRPMSTGQQGVETNINENADHRVMEEATSVDDDAQKIVGGEEVKPPGKYPYIPTLMVVVPRLSHPMCYCLLHTVKVISTRYK